MGIKKRERSFATQHYEETVTYAAGHKLNLCLNLHHTAHQTLLLNADAGVTTVTRCFKFKLKSHTYQQTPLSSVME